MLNRNCLLIALICIASVVSVPSYAGQGRKVNHPPIEDFAYGVGEVLNAVGDILQLPLIIAALPIAFVHEVLLDDVNMASVEKHGSDSDHILAAGYSEETHNYNRQLNNVPSKTWGKHAY